MAPTEMDKVYANKMLGLLSAWVAGKEVTKFPCIKCGLRCMG
jgi:hypothetical protein